MMYLGKTGPTSVSAGTRSAAFNLESVAPSHQVGKEFVCTTNESGENPEIHRS